MRVHDNNNSNKSERTLDARRVGVIELEYSIAFSLALALALALAPPLKRESDLKSDSCDAE